MVLGTQSFPLSHTCVMLISSLFQLEEQVPFFFQISKEASVKVPIFFKLSNQRNYSTGTEQSSNKRHAIKWQHQFLNYFKTKLNYKCWRYRSDNLLFQMRGGTTQKRQVFLMPHECIKKARDFILQVELYERIDIERFSIECCKIQPNQFLSSQTTQPISNHSKTKPITYQLDFSAQFKLHNSKTETKVMFAQFTTFNTQLESAALSVFKRAPVNLSS